MLILLSRSHISSILLSQMINPKLKKKVILHAILTDISEFLVFKAIWLSFEYQILALLLILSIIAII